MEGLTFTGGILSGCFTNFTNPLNPIDKYISHCPSKNIIRTYLSIQLRTRIIVTMNEATTKQ